MMVFLENEDIRMTIGAIDPGSFPLAGLYQIPECNLQF